MKSDLLIRRRWWIAALLFVAGLINYFDRTIISVALPAIAESLHLRPSQMGVLLSAFFWSYALMQVPIGWLADRMNLRWLYAGCFALWSITSGLTGLAASLGMLLLLRVLLGIGESVYLPGGMKIVSLLFEPRQRGFASALVNCGTRLGLAFGAPLIAALVVNFGWRQAFFILGFVALAWLPPWLASFRSDLDPAPQPGGAAVKPAATFISRQLAGVCVANIGYGYYFYLLVTWLPAYLVQSRHLPLQTAAAYAVVPYLTFALGEPLGGLIADLLIARGWEETLARKIVITAGYASGILLLPAGLTSRTSLSVILLGAAALVGLSTGNLYALVQKVSPAGKVGFSVGLFNLSGNVPGIIAPLVTGLIVEGTGSYYPAFVVAVTVLLAVLPIAWWMLRPTAQHASL